MLMRLDNCRSGSAVAVALSNSGERRSCCRGCRNLAQTTCRLNDGTSVSAG